MIFHCIPFHYYATCQCITFCHISFHYVPIYHMPFPSWRVFRYIRVSLPYPYHVAELWFVCWIHHRPTLSPGHDAVPSWCHRGGRLQRRLHNRPENLETGHQRRRHFCRLSVLQSGRPFLSKPHRLFSLPPPGPFIWRNFRQKSHRHTVNVQRRAPAVRKRLALPGRHTLLRGTVWALFSQQFNATVRSDQCALFVTAVSRELRDPAEADLCAVHPRLSLWRCDAGSGGRLLFPSSRRAGLWRGGRRWVGSRVAELWSSLRGAVSSDDVFNTFYTFFCSISESIKEITNLFTMQPVLHGVLRIFNKVSKLYTCNFYPLVNGFNVEAQFIVWNIDFHAQVFFC